MAFEAPAGGTATMEPPDADHPLPLARSGATLVDTILPGCESDRDGGSEQDRPITSMADPNAI